MKITVKIEDSRVVVVDKNDSVIGIWNHAKIAEAGGLEFCIEKFKNANPKAEVIVIGTLPTTPAPEATTAAPEATTAAPEATTAAPEATTAALETTTPVV